MKQLERMTRALAFAGLATSVVAGSASALVFNVNDAADAPDANLSDGVCGSARGGCTLRAAVMQANFSAGVDEIDLPAGLFALSIPGKQEDAGLTGDLDVHESVTIRGVGFSSTYVDASYLDRVFDVHAGAANVAFEDMTIRNGSAESAAQNAPIHEGAGGGIRARGANLSIENVWLRHSQARSGGGLFVDGDATILDSRIHDNQTAWGGGGILANYGQLVLERVIVSANSGHNGGGLRALRGDGEVRESAFVYNTSHSGGGVSISGLDPQEWRLVNTTISNNRADAGGGLETEFEGHVVLDHVTIASNAASLGGGILVYPQTDDFEGPLVEIRHSILADNVGGDGSGNDCSTYTSAIVSKGRNLIENPSSCAFALISTDLPTGVDPKLALLSYQAGTYSHTLSYSSLVRDAAANHCPPIDQRGVARPQGAACDVGAIELEIDPDAPIALDDHFSFALAGPVLVAAPGVLQNDTDPNGDALTVDSASASPSQGAVSMNPNGSFVFVPASLSGGTRTFTYRATDGTHLSNTATVEVESGGRREIWTLLEVPEIPWLDPGPYRTECIAIWQDGTLAAQTYGAGHWETQGTSSARTASKQTVGSRSEAFTFNASLEGVDGSRTRLEGRLEAGRFTGLATDERGRRVEVQGFENAECNALDSLESAGRLGFESRVSGGAR